MSLLTTTKHYHHSTSPIDFFPPSLLSRATNQIDAIYDTLATRHTRHYNQIQNPAMSLAARNDKVLLPVVRRGLKSHQQIPSTGPALIAAGQQRHHHHHHYHLQTARRPQSPLLPSIHINNNNTAITTRSFHLTSHARNPASSSSSGGFGAVGAIPPSYFQRPSLPANTVIRFVPQQTAWIVERMGKFNRILEPGLAILVPFIDRIAYVKSLKEVAIEIPSQSAITADNVTLELDGVLYTRVFDAYKARYVHSLPFYLFLLSSYSVCLFFMLTSRRTPQTAMELKTPSTPSRSSPRPQCAAKSASCPSTTY